MQFAIVTTLLLMQHVAARATCCSSGIGLPIVADLPAIDKIYLGTSCESGTGWHLVTAANRAILFTSLSIFRVSRASLL